MSYLSLSLIFFESFTHMQQHGMAFAHGFNAERVRSMRWSQPDPDPEPEPEPGLERLLCSFFKQVSVSGGLEIKSDNFIQI